MNTEGLTFRQQLLSAWRERERKRIHSNTAEQGTAGILRRMH